ncbi:hypothetical protein ACOZGD_01190 [Streptomyces murinus]
MGQQGDRIFAVTAERGFPDPWLSFGDSLCSESALSTELKHAIGTARKEDTAGNLFAVEAAFTAKKDNLRHSERLLSQVLSDYDVSGEWEHLDEKAGRLDIEDVAENWGRVVGLHPYPVVVESLRFNWRYMKTHGVRGFYEMTTGYVAALIANTERWEAAWAEERKTGVIDRLTTIECDLASIEAPMHCDVCKKTITAILYVDE